MTKPDFEALQDLRKTLVEERRQQGRSRNLDGVLAAQDQIDGLDRAISDERALTHQEETVERRRPRAATPVN